MIQQQASLWRQVTSRQDPRDLNYDSGRPRTPIEKSQIIKKLKKQVKVPKPKIQILKEINYYVMDDQSTKTIKKNMIIQSAPQGCEDKSTPPKIHKSYQPPILRDQSPSYTKREKQKLIEILSFMIPKSNCSIVLNDKETDPKYHIKFGILPSVFHKNNVNDKLKTTLANKFDDQMAKKLGCTKEHLQKHRKQINRHGFSCEDEFDPTKIFISQDGIGYKVWSKIICYLCIASSYSYIHIAAFQPTQANIVGQINAVEFIFLIDMLVQFKLDYKDSFNKVIRDHEKITQRYFQQGTFVTDAIALLPFHMLQLQRNRWSYSLVIKIIRLKRGLDNFDINLILVWFKKYQMKELDNLIKNDHFKANSIDLDQTKIGTILMTSFCLKILKMMLLIFSCSYFFAMIFKILLDIQNDYRDWDQYAVDDQEQPEHFTEFYGLSHQDFSNSDMRYQIILLYFSFTTLTTVGFGDYNPRSDMERIFIAFGLLFGVAIFSYIMGEFTAIVQSYGDYNNFGDEDDQLASFFGVMAQFNNKELFNIKLKREIENYFDYRWDQDKYIVINPQNQNFLEQVPVDVQVNLLKTFLFKEFLTSYHRTFDFSRKGQNKLMRYTWDHQNYQNLMVKILENLEPIQYQKNYIIMDELDESAYVVFLLEDVYYQIGYSINKQHHFRIKQKNQDIGAYATTFDKKSCFIYRTSKESQGYFIRRKNWKNIINNQDLEETVTIMKNKIKERYDFISRILNNLKDSDINIIAMRNGPEGVIQLSNKHPHFFRQKRKKKKDEFKDSQSLYFNKLTSEAFLDDSFSDCSPIKGEEVELPSDIAKYFHVSQAGYCHSEKSISYDDRKVNIDRKMTEQEETISKIRNKLDFDKLREEYFDLEVKYEIANDKLIKTKAQKEIRENQLKKDRKLLNQSFQELKSTSGQLQEIKQKYEALLVERQQQQQQQ